MSQLMELIMPIKRWSQDHLLIRNNLNTGGLKAKVVIRKPQGPDTGLIIQISAGIVYSGGILYINSNPLNITMGILFLNYATSFHIKNQIL